ncbi:recombination regulator RecX [Streptacidiphilus pinicola]|uniref:recombination regulator RecX n=1 Tax=Streptacidiphilus pinicola TaxID=2219663 RepID=UPI001FB56DAA|nr:recombination regulator RecX [Streptacidiphilus pinicola]
MSTSTESAWGPRDWSSHGGGGRWEEPPADRAPAPDPERDGLPSGGPLPDGPRRRSSAYDDATGGHDDEAAPFGAARGRRSSRRGSRRSAQPAGGRTRARNRASAEAWDEASHEASAHGASEDGPRDTAPTDPASRARDICLRLLTGSARTRKQLADALRRKEIPDEIAEEVLDRLTEVGLIDDAAYARSWVEQRQRSRGLARRALAGELRAKGVDSALVAEAVAEVDPDDEEAAARRLVERKLASTRGLDRQVRLRRLAGMLARRGYPEGLALRVVRAALDAEPEDDEGFEDDPFLDSGEE